MEVQKIHPKSRKIVIAKSSAVLTFINCPKEKTISRKIKIPQICAEWWIEVKASASYHYRYINMYLDTKNVTIASSPNTFDQNSENSKSYAAKYNITLNGKKKEIELELKKSDEPIKKELMYIYCDPKNELVNDNFKVKEMHGFDLQIDCEVEISFKAIGYKCEVVRNFDFSPVLEGIHELYNSGKFSDFTFIVSGKEFKVHRNILSLASPVFATMFEIDLDEKKLNLAKVDCAPEIFHYLMEFIYSGKLPEKFADVAMKLYEIAHLYQMESLSRCCLDHIMAKEIIEENVLDLYQFAIKYDLKDLFDRSWDFIKFELLKIFKPIERDPFTLEEILEYLEIIEEQKCLDLKMEKFYKCVKVPVDSNISKTE